MRVLKDTNVRYKSFVDMLYAGSGTAEPAETVIDLPENKEPADNNGLRLINAFAKKIENAKTVIDTTETLSSFFGNNFGVTGSEIFLFDKSKKNLVPLGINKNGRFLSLIKHLTDEESIDWIFSKRNHTGYSELMTYNLNGVNTKLLIVPIFYKGRRKGILLISSLRNIFSDNSGTYEIVESILNMTMSRIELLMYKKQLKDAARELQVYQSKSSNDVRLLAIGELALGAIEGLLNPMQIILSYAEMLAKENNSSDNEAVDVIKEQVNEVSKVISGIIRFSQRDKESFRIQPVNINVLLNEFNSIAEQSVKNKNYELILDLQKNLPTILSNRNQIYQLFTNVFTLILSNASNEGGIFIQTRFNDDNVTMRINFTGYMPVLNEQPDEHSGDLTIDIIRSIMEKHEGSLETSSSQQTGSTIVLTFPLQRKKVK